MKGQNTMKPRQSCSCSLMSTIPYESIIISVDLILYNTNINDVETHTATFECTQCKKRYYPGGRLVPNICPDGHVNYAFIFACHRDYGRSTSIEVIEIDTLPQKHIL